MKYHVLPCGSVVTVEEQGRNEASKPFNGISFVDADGNRQSMASKVLRESGTPVRKARKVIRVKGKAPRQ